MKIKIDNEYFNLYVYNNNNSLSEIVNEINMSKIFNRHLNFNILLQGWEYKTVERVGSNIFLEVGPGVVDFISTREVLADTKRNKEFLEKASETIIEYYIDMIEKEIPDIYFINLVKKFPSITRYFPSIKNRFLKIINDKSIYLDSVFHLDYGKYFYLTSILAQMFGVFDNTYKQLKVSEMLDIDYSNLNLTMPLLDNNRLKIFYNVKDDKDKRKVFAYARQKYNTATIALTDKKEKINNELIPDVEYINSQNINNNILKDKTKSISRIEEVKIQKFNKHLDEIALKDKKLTTQVLGQKDSCYIITDETFYIYNSGFKTFIYKNQNRFKKFYIIMTSKVISLFNSIKTDNENIFIHKKVIDKEKYGDYLVDLKSSPFNNRLCLREGENFKEGVIAKAIMRELINKNLNNPKILYLVEKMNDRYNTQLDLVNYRKEIGNEFSYYIGDNQKIFDEVSDYVKLTKKLILDTRVSDKRFKKSMDILDRYSKI